MMQEINTVNSIEVSSLCDNQCPYCPAKDQGKYRRVGLMPMETFKKALEWVVKCVKKGTQRELNLFGVGEPTLNPLLINMITMARQILPLRLPVHINTNGNSMTKELARDLRRAGINHIDITGHDALKTAQCIRIFKQEGIEGSLSMDFMTAPNNWAGQVDWLEPDYHYPCPWLEYGQVMIMSNGDVTNCCIDAFASGVFANVHRDQPEDQSLVPMKLCDTCHQDVPERMQSNRILLAGG